MPCLSRNICLLPCIFYVQYHSPSFSEKIGGSLTPKIPESLIWLIFLRKFKFLVDRTAVLCYNTIIGQEGCVVYEIKN